MKSERRPGDNFYGFYTIILYMVNKTVSVNRISVPETILNRISGVSCPTRLASQERLGTAGKLRRRIFPGGHRFKKILTFNLSGKKYDGDARQIK